MNNNTALDWIKMGNLDSIIGEDDLIPLHALHWL